MERRTKWRMGVVAAILTGVLAVCAWVIIQRYRSQPHGTSLCVLGRKPVTCRQLASRLAHHGPLSVRCLVSNTGRPVVLESGDLTLTADLYRPSGADDQAPAIVVVHGSSVYGRRLPLVRVLGTRLAARGYVVLAPDLRGFGDSEDPHDLDDPGSFDFASDIAAAVDYLSALPNVRGKKIHAIGHSFGAGAVLSALAREPRLGRAVLFGPPRRFYERMFRPNAPDSAYFERRARRDMQLSHPPGSRVWREATRSFALESYADSLHGLGTPLFLIDSEWEDPADLEFLRRIVGTLSPSTAYWTVAGTHHYLSTGLIAGFPCYNATLVGSFLTRVESWIEEGGEAVPATN